MASGSHSSSSSEWTDEQIETILITIVITLASIATFYCLLRRPGPNHNPHLATAGGEGGAGAGIATRQEQVGAVQGQGQGQGQPSMTGINHNRNIRNVSQTSTASSRSTSNHSIGHHRTTNHNEGEEEEEDGVNSVLAANTRKPPHFTNPSSSAAAKGGGGLSLGIPSRVHHEGVIPFRYTLASTFELRSAALATNMGGVASTKSSQQLTNRKDRARVFTKLFSSSFSNGTENDNGNGNGNEKTKDCTNANHTPIPPPNRGSNIVITIPESDIPCRKLQRVLFLLGTYYNLFLMIDTTNQKKKHLIHNENKEDATRPKSSKISGNSSSSSSVDDNYIKDKKRLDGLILQLRSGTDVVDESNGNNCGLSEEVLPSHKIVTTASVSSRVAFVRQLPKAEIIIDYENECMAQLTRFGFKVLLYPLKTDMNDSSLGSNLLS